MTGLLLNSRWITLSRPVRFAHKMDRHARYTDEQVARKLAQTERSLKGEWSIMAALVEAGIHPLAWDGDKNAVAKRALKIRKGE